MCLPLQAAVLLDEVPRGGGSLPQAQVVNEVQDKHMAWQQGEVCQGLPKGYYFLQLPEVNFSCTGHQFSSLLKAAPYCSTTRHINFSLQHFIRPYLPS